MGYDNNNLDCNEADPDVLSGMPEDWEICNGKVDRCEDDDNLTPPDDERDDDGDGFVGCVLDVDRCSGRPQPRRSATWGAGTVKTTMPTLTGCTGDLQQGGGEFQWRWSCADIVPTDEVDNDGDCFVECSGFDASTWEGDPHVCEYTDLTGQLVQETTVIGGDDCLDSAPNARFTYPGAAYLDSTTECSCDNNFDGIDDGCGVHGSVMRTDGTWVDIYFRSCESPCDAVTAKDACTAYGQRVVSHASNGTSEVYSLGATASCQHSISYFKTSGAKAPDQCLVAIRSGMVGCCGFGSWHGQTMPFGSVNDVFGYVHDGNSGFQAQNTQISHTHSGGVILKHQCRRIRWMQQYFVACTSG